MAFRRTECSESEILEATPSPLPLMEYTFIGDVVNVAFLIEALNKKFDSKLLISDPVRQAVEIGDAERLAPIPIRGRREPVELWRLA